MSPIEIVAYRSHWAAEFTEIGRRLRESLGDQAQAIWHIGSTSVPGLRAKDVIDVQVRVASLDLDEDFKAALAAADLPFRPDGPRRDHLPVGEEDRPGDWDKAMAGARPRERRVHVHLRVAGRPNERYPLLFRDYLRVMPSVAGAYGVIKANLAALHPNDVDAYYEIKEPVCDLIMGSADSWAQRSGWDLPPTDA
jgi:GrpB-like predicted nucleotidyltransferase (UPF0157 family)